MMMKYYAASFFCLVFSAIISAQKTEQGLDINFKPVSNGWHYYAVTEKKDDLWHRQVYYVQEKSIAMVGSYKDQDCKIAEGKIIWYYPNKNPKSSSSYKEGKQQGIALRFHENGMMSDSSGYSNGRRIGVSLGWDEEGNQVDSTNFNGNGVVVRWYKNGSVNYAGRIINDTTRINRWIYYHSNGKQMALEDYVNGKVARCSCSDELGNQLDSSLCVEKEAYFPGDEKSWRNFLAKNLNANVPVKNRAPEGTYMVLVQFIVDKEGQVTDIKPLTKFGFGMEEEVVRILKKAPRWTPAFQFGRNVKAYRKQPVTFVVARS
jgi:hypothetical protein